MAVARGSLAFHIGRSYVTTSCSDVVNKKKKEMTENQSKFEVNPEEEPFKVESKSVSDERNRVFLDESDFEEKFIRGSGPGGQKVNKTSNCVQLKHKETGIVIKCHESRSLQTNREIARGRLLDKLKALFTPSESSTYKKIEKKKKNEGQAMRRRRLKEDAATTKVDL